MDALALAKRRSGRRRRQGGAAMFLVAMTIAVLASVGIYALAAASNELRTSGNERQNTQTHYLAEYGILGATHELQSFKANTYLTQMTQRPEPVCLSLPGVPSTADKVTRACYRMEDNLDFKAAWTGTSITVKYTGSTPYAAGVAPGSFGATPMNGNFFVELTDPVQLTPPSKYATNLNFCFVQLTLTATGITQPVFAWQTGADLTSQFSGEGLEMQRARIVAGPVTCPK
jgi:Tfp pilus assembly protein PilX